jgi:hypothetical protein
LGKMRTMRGAAKMTKQQDADDGVESMVQVPSKVTAAFDSIDPQTTSLKPTASPLQFRNGYDDMAASLHRLEDDIDGDEASTGGFKPTGADADADQEVSKEETLELDEEEEGDQVTGDAMEDEGKGEPKGKAEERGSKPIRKKAKVIGSHQKQDQLEGTPPSPPHKATVKANVQDAKLWKKLDKIIKPDKVELEHCTRDHTFYGKGIQVGGLWDFFMACQPNGGPPVRQGDIIPFKGEPRHLGVVGVGQHKVSGNLKVFVWHLKPLRSCPKIKMLEFSKINIAAINSAHRMTCDQHARMLKDWEVALPQLSRKIANARAVSSAVVKEEEEVGKQDRSEDEEEEVGKRQKRVVVTMGKGAGRARGKGSGKGKDPSQSYSPETPKTKQLRAMEEALQGVTGKIDALTATNQELREQLANSDAARDGPDRFDLDAGIEDGFEGGFPPRRHHHSGGAAEAPRSSGGAAEAQPRPRSSGGAAEAQPRPRVQPPPPSRPHGYGHDRWWQ